MDKILWYKKCQYIMYHKNINIEDYAIRFVLDEKKRYSANFIYRPPNYPGPIAIDATIKKEKDETPKTS